MNFFGHSVVAGWRAGDGPERRAVALGAMLPDFAGMVRRRMDEVAHVGVACGVDLHHATDRAFHRLRDFRSLCRDVEAELRDAGLRRGPARASAHVGVELLLDGVLVERHGDDAPYLDALEAAAPDALGGLIDWREPDGARRFEHLRGRLLARGLPRGYADAGVTCDRVVRTLADRPLLALDTAEEARLRDHIDAVATRVAARAAVMMDELRRAL